MLYDCSADYKYPPENLPDAGGANRPNRATRIRHAAQRKIIAQSDRRPRQDIACGVSGDVTDSGVGMPIRAYPICYPRLTILRKYKIKRTAHAESVCADRPPAFRLYIHNATIRPSTRSFVFPHRSDPCQSAIWAHFGTRRELREGAAIWSARGLLYQPSPRLRRLLWRPDWCPCDAMVSPSLPFSLRSVLVMARHPSLLVSSCRRPPISVGPVSHVDSTQDISYITNKNCANADIP